MAYKNRDKIVRMVKKKEEAFAKLYARMELDFDLLTLKDNIVEEGYCSFTSSAPRNFHEKIMDGLNRAVLNIQIKVPHNDTDEGKKQASVAEQFVFGEMHDIDRIFRKQNLPSFREQISFYICNRGWWAYRLLLNFEKSEEGSEEEAHTPDCAVFDPLHLSWEAGPGGLIWVCHHYNASAAEILDKWDHKLPEDVEDAWVFDFYDKENNCVIIESSKEGASKTGWAKKVLPHNFKRVPIAIGSVGSMPNIQDKDGGDTIEHRGDSVYASSRKLFKPYNDQIGLMMDIEKRSVHGTLTYETEDGTKEIDGEPWLNFQVVKLARDEKLKPLEIPGAPPEAAAVFGSINTDIQQSTLPYPIAYGGTQQALSGAALNVLGENTRSVYTPRSTALEHAYTHLCEELMRQFHEGGAKAATFQGFNSKDNFFHTKIKPDEIDPGWYVHVTCRPRMPRDKEAEFMMAQIAMQPTGPAGLPMLPRQKVYEEILQEPDPVGTEEAVIVEWGESQPPVMLRKTAAAVKEDGGEDISAELMMMKDQMLGIPPGGMQQGGMSPEGAPSGGAPQGGGLPPIPPELLQQGPQVVGQMLVENNVPPEVIEQILTENFGPPPSVR